MNKKDLQKWEKRLLDELQSAARAMGRIERGASGHSPRDSSRDRSAYSSHMADLGSDASERELDFQVASTEGRIVLQIREALERIREGSYGTCEDCGKPISAKRLDLLPYTVRCAKCQTAFERSGS